MTIDEQVRHDLFTGLQAAVGVEPAKLMMTAIPPFSWSEIVTKADLAQFATRDETQAEFTAVRNEMHTEFAVVHNEMRTEFAAVRNEMKFEFAAVRSEMRADSAAIRDEMHADSAAIRDEMHAEFATVRDEMHADSASIRDEMHAGSAAIRLEIANRTIQILAQFGKLQWNLFFQIAAFNISTAGIVIAALHYLR